MQEDAYTDRKVMCIGAKRELRGFQDDVCRVSEGIEGRTRNVYRG